MATYSFLDVTASITGPGGVVALASSAGVAEEGITVEASQDKNKMIIGADGAGMHSLIADESSEVSIKLLKTSPANSLLQGMLNYQTTSAVLHGKNHIVIVDTARGDNIILNDVAFKKQPGLEYAKEGKFVEWKFEAIRTHTILGVGTPEL